MFSMFLTITSTQLLNSIQEKNTMRYTKPEIAQLGAADVLIEQTGEKFGPRRLDPIDPTGHFFMFNPAYDLDE